MRSTFKGLNSTLYDDYNSLKERKQLKNETYRSRTLHQDAKLERASVRKSYVDRGGYYPLGKTRPTEEKISERIKNIND